MEKALTLQVGVVLAREAIEHPWQEHRWRPVRVTLDSSRYEQWQEIERGKGYAHYFAGYFPLELHHTETPAYHVNFANGEPTVYIVLRDTSAAPSPKPIHVHLVTASPFEAQAYGSTGDEMIESVQMPEPLVTLTREFMTKHHVDVTFKKRQRDRHHKANEPYLFGQEPVHVVRARQLARRASEGPTDA